MKYTNDKINMKLYNVEVGGEIGIKSRCTVWMALKRPSALKPAKDIG